jgi:hypothetical protein
MKVSPIARIQRTRDELALDVALQEALLVIREQFLAIEPVGQRGEASARNAGDDIHFVEQAHLVPARPDDFCPLQKLEDSVRERRRARAAAGECEDDKVFLALEVPLARQKRITRVRVRLRNRGIDRTRGTAAEHYQSNCDQPGWEPWTHPCLDQGSKVLNVPV